MNFKKYNCFFEISKENGIGDQQSVDNVLAYSCTSIMNKNNGSYIMRVEGKY